MTGQEGDPGKEWRQCERQTPLVLFLFLVSFPDPHPDSTAAAKPRMGSL